MEDIDEQLLRASRWPLNSAKAEALREAARRLHETPEGLKVVRECRGGEIGWAGPRSLAVLDTVEAVANWLRQLADEVQP